MTGPDSANGRKAASGAGGRGFDPWPRHTKGVKMLPVVPLFALSIMRQALTLLSLTTNTTHIAQKLTKKQTNKKQQLTPSTWFPGTRLMSPPGVKTYR